MPYWGNMRYSMPSSTTWNNHCPLLIRFPAAKELDQARKLLLQVIEVVREHFAKEEQVVYRLAPQSLSAEILTDLGAQWAAHRAIVLA